MILSRVLTKNTFYPARVPTLARFTFFFGKELEQSAEDQSSSALEEGIIDQQMFLILKDVMFIRLPILMRHMTLE